MKQRFLILVIASICVLGYALYRSDMSPRLSGDVFHVDGPSMTNRDETTALKPEDIQAAWTSLCDRGGCLTGSQDYANGSISEGSIFRMPEWKAFFDLDPNVATPFLLQFADSRRETRFHVCPFENAWEGEFAFYVLQHIRKKNWFDAPIEGAIFERARRLHKERRQEGFRLALMDEDVREALKFYFRTETVGARHASP
ncbi:MAG TPA: hypothetical protein PLU87_06980 [Sedimentisphaerales bacterium]|nr:hypothetical protein [Sedimentisphaerales bacterium]HRS10594.1 hypothetical protein [Sedimentisphaerales bacterium]HRV47182.1 hypothetical protein [Sedimentisphaerales bacterium]